ncbi:MAG: hypothetical protein JXA60_09780 [Candidatus Coatesbacteria bacterium]|nr:hypothetical protein [Candidatus Coatesbacteria bacterium]
MEAHDAELFLALTNRRRNKKGELVIGITYSDLIKSTENDFETIKTSLDSIQEYIEPLGLTIVNVDFKGEKHFAIVSVFPSPSELTEDLLSLLGLIISISEEKDNACKPVDLKYLKKTVLDNNYLNSNQLEKGIKQLVNLGYIIKNPSSIEYNIRLLLEYPKEIRQKIAIEAKLIL